MLPPYIAAIISCSLRYMTTRLMLKALAVSFNDEFNRESTIKKSLSSIINTLDDIFVKICMKN